MDLSVYLWVEDITVFIRELIRFFGIMHPNNKTKYREEFDTLDNVLFRYIYLGDISRNIGVYICIEDYDDEYYKFIAGEYGTVVNVYLTFDDAHFGKRYMLIAEIVNWIMRISDTDLAIEFTHDDEWVFCSEEHIREMERWRKQQEKSEKTD